MASLRPPHLWVIASVLMSVVAAVWPPLAFPAVVAVLLAVLNTTGRHRLLAGLLGGVLALVAFVRFTVEVAVPGIVAGGKRSTEEKAVSRLREIHWAQQRARELKLSDADGDGTAEFVPLATLTDPKATGGVALLKPEQFRPIPPTADGTPLFHAEGYAYQLHLPTTPDGAEQRYIAYAWPLTPGVAGTRAFVIDERENICETPNTQGYAGAARAPSAVAALQGPTLDAARCGTGQDGATWKPWKKKQLRQGPAPAPAGNEPPSP